MRRLTGNRKEEVGVLSLWSLLKSKTWQLETAVLAVAVFLFAALPAWAGLNQWTLNGGPTTSSDMVSSLAISPNYVLDETIFLGTSSNTNAATKDLLYKSTDNGVSWTTGTGLNDGRYVAVAFSPNYANDQTVLTSSNWTYKVYKSVDGGSVWTQVSGLPTNVFWDLGFSPAYTTDNTIFAAGNSGVYKSTDGGTSWSAVNNGLTYTAVSGGLAISPNFENDKTLFVGENNYGVFKSVDGGANWTNVSSGLPQSSGYPGPSIQSLAISPNYAHDSTLFTSVEGGGIYKSTDGGTSWVQVYGVYANSLVLSPNYANDQTVFAMIVGVNNTVIKSDNRGEAWVSLGGISGSYGNLAISPDFANDKTIFVANINGVYSYTFPPVNLPRTGQTACYDSSGNIIACAGTGQDGDIQAGVAWPSPRFTDNGDGTITDNLTGLIWQQDGSTPTVGTCTGGAMTWQGALDYVACLNANNYLGHNDWRLPNRIELESLVDDGQSDQASWLDAEGFTNTQATTQSYYWSSTTSLPSSHALGVYFYDGYVGNYSKTGASYVRCVRGGRSGSLDNAIISLPKTGQTTCYDSSGNVISCTGTGQDGDVQAGVAWPSPRFTDNGDGMVTDNLTGLIWQQDGSTPTVGTCTGGAMTWQGALDYVACLNANNYLGHNDWRLPNRIELESLVDDGQAGQDTWLNTQGFVNTQASAYWSSTTRSDYMYDAWSVNANNGGDFNGSKGDAWYVRCVRGGQSGSLGNLVLTVLKTGTGTGTVTSDSGTIVWSGSTGTVTYTSGTIVALTATSDSGSTFAGWSGDCNSSGQVTMDSAKTCTATFTLNQYTVTPSAGAGGTISPNTAQTVNYNGTTSFTATPNTGYHIASVTGCGGTLIGNTYTTGTITADCTVSAIFAANVVTYTVTPSAGANGSISPNTVQTVNYNGTTSFTVTPNTGYQISSVTGCGGILSGNTYTTGPITADCTVSATFSNSGGATAEDQIRANFYAIQNAIDNYYAALSYPSPNYELANSYLDIAMSYVSANYYDRGGGVSKASEAFTNFFPDYILDPNSITVNGDNALSVITWYGWPGEGLNWINENGVWKIYGSQRKYQVMVRCMHDYPTNSYYAQIVVKDPNRLISSVTASGPDIVNSTALSLNSGEGGKWEVFVPLGPDTPTIPLTYTLNISDSSGTYAYNEDMTGYVADFATNLSPTGSVSGPITFSWSGVPGAAFYQIFLSGPDGFFTVVNQSAGIPNNTTTYVYEDPNLMPGTYTYQVISYNVTYDETSVSFNHSYSQPQSFTYSGATPVGSCGGALSGNVGMSAYSPPVTVLFNNVTSCGTTSVSNVAVPAPVANYTVVGAYDITFAGTFSNGATVCIQYDPSKVGGNASQLRLLHYTNNAYKDITAYVRTLGQDQICGVTTSFSPFVVAYPTQPVSFANFAWQNDGTTSYKVNFNASSSTCPTSTCSYSWNFGDSSSTGSGALTSHTYADGTPREVTLTALASNGASSSITKIVTPVAVHHFPHVDGSVQWQSGKACLFTDNSTAGSAASVYLNWGDGSPLDIGPLMGTMTHSYLSNGSYTITQIVQDDMGFSGTKKYSIRITDAAVQGEGTLTISADSSSFPISYYVKGSDSWGNMYTKASGTLNAPPTGASATLSLSPGSYDVYIYFASGHTCASWTQPTSVTVTSGGDTPLNLTGCN